MTLINVVVPIEVTDEDIDDIMCTAWEGGITYWCGYGRIVEHNTHNSIEYEGYAYEQLTKGKDILLYPIEECYSPSGLGRDWLPNKFGEGFLVLNKNKMVKGIVKYFSRYPSCISLSYGDLRLDTGDIDADIADRIVQYALFGKLVYA